jgi:hypothetical protein
MNRSLHFDSMSSKIRYFLRFSRFLQSSAATDPQCSVRLGPLFGPRLTSPTRRFEGGFEVNVLETRPNF